MKKRIIALFLAVIMVVTLLPVSGGADNKEELTSASIKLTQTDIAADGVFNTGGYGSLVINETYTEVLTPNGTKVQAAATIPQAALINEQGELIFPYTDTWLRYRYSDGVVSLTASSTYLSYYCNTTAAGTVDMPHFYAINGTELFKNTYRYATPMTDGYAFVIGGDSTDDYAAHLIDKTGKAVYDFPESFGRYTGFGWGEMFAFFNPDDKCGWPSEGLIACGTTIDSRYGIYRYDEYRNMSGEVVFSNDGYADASPFHDGLAKVQSADTGLFGYIDHTGAEVIPCQYEGASDFCDGYVCAKTEGKWGYIDKSGNTIIPFMYDNAYGAGDGLFSVVKDGKCGLVNINNELVVPFEYDDISSFDGGAAYAIKDGKVIIITKDEDAIAFDKCGNDLTWTLDENGILTISGTGDMWDYSRDTPAPWDEHKNSINTVNISDGITSIGDYAFYYCSDINNVSIGNSVTSIGSYAFCTCTGITSIKLPVSLETISSNAFRNCKISCIEFPNSVISVGHEAFCACRSLERIDFGNSIKTIGNAAFSSCTAIKSVIIPDSVDTIEGYAFQNCSAIESVTIGKNIKTIGNLSFSMCGNLSVAEFCGNAPATFGTLAFSGCANGFKIIAPENDSWRGTAYKPEAGTWNSYPIEFAHNYNAVVTAPTCTEKGYTTYTCSCGDSYVDDYVDALGHSFGVWETKEKATCTEKGIQQRKCSRCSTTETRDINPHGHSLWNGICSECGFIDMDEHEHIFSDKYYDGSCTKDAYVIRTCACGYSYKAIMDPATGHHFVGEYCEWCGAKNPNFKVLDAPKIKITLSDGKPKLTWKAVDGAKEYAIFRATSKNGKYTGMYSTKKTSYTNTSAKAGTTYYYKITAIDSTGIASEFSNTVYIPSKCSAPTVKIKAVASSGKPSLSWDAVPFASKYVVYRATSKDGKYTKMYTTSKTGYTNTSAKAGKTYYYKVKAISDFCKDSSYSSVKYLTCDLARPTVKITTSKGDPKLSWEKIDGATKYEVYRATSKSGTYSKMITTSKTSYTNTSAKAGKTYYYKVKAVCGTSAAASAYSTVVSIKAK